MPEDIKVSFRVLDPDKRPVSAVADQLEVRDIDRVEVCVDRGRALTLLFDPEHALDERISMEQFAFLSGARHCEERSDEALLAMTGAWHIARVAPRETPLL
jgi:hypothetical protein